MKKRTGMICAAGAVVLCGSLVASARVGVSRGLAPAPVTTYNPFTATATPTAPAAAAVTSLPSTASPVAVQAAVLQLRPPPRSPYRPPPSGGLF